MEKEQLELANKISFDWDETRSINVLAGLDITFTDNGKAIGCCCLTTPSGDLIASTILHIDLAKSNLVLPEYKAGLLGFREVPIYKLLLEKTIKEHQISPDICIIDGNGILHPRKCGSASHFGLATGIPTIGVAKSLHHIDGLDRKKIRSKLGGRGIQKSIELIGNTDYNYGYAVRATGCLRPVFVSIGHMISREKCLEVIEQCMKLREPEPTRLADRLSRKYLRDISDARALALARAT